MNSCATCGGILITDPFNKKSPNCRSCRDALAAGQSPDTIRASAVAAREEAAVTDVLERAVQIDGRPWWEAGRATFAVAYADLDALNEEAVLASEAGYSLGAVSAIDGHLNLGRTMVGLVAAGPLGAAAAASRSAVTILAVWRKA